MQLRYGWLLLLLALSVGCKTSSDTDETQEQAEEEPAPYVESPGFVTTISGLRHQPTTESKVRNEEGKEIRNWRTTLHAGEEVTITGEEGGWYAVRASDDTEGWLKRDDVLQRTDKVSLATVFSETQTFLRPDLLAGAKAELSPGALLFVVDTKDQFNNVRYGNADVWVMSDKLTTDTTEVSVSRLLAKARWLKRRKDESYREILELAVSQFPQSQLLKAVRENGSDDLFEGVELGLAPTKEQPPEGESPKDLKKAMDELSPQGAVKDQDKEKPLAAAESTP